MQYKIKIGIFFYCSQIKYSYRKFKTIKHLIVAQLCIIISLCLPPLLTAKDVMPLPGQVDHYQPQIRIVMAAAFVSESGIGIYNEIFHYLGEKLNKEVVFVSGFSYSTINAMLDAGMVLALFVVYLTY